jgi:hypothetical protein
MALSGHENRVGEYLLLSAKQALDDADLNVCF